MISILRILPTFPDFKRKAVTTSYDDGCMGDERMMSIMRKNGMKGTFNLNSGYMTGKLYAPDAGRCNPNEVKKRYDNKDFEVATHFETHALATAVPLANTAIDIINDREYLEGIFDSVITGCAYPFGCVNKDVAEMLKKCGIHYARTVVSTHSFSLPHNPIMLDTTCHHNDKQLFSLVDKFISEEPKDYEEPWLFYLWGHAYEFDNDNNWEVFESFCEKVGNRNDVWYATNGDIVGYLEAFNRLSYSADGTLVKNNSCRDIFISAQLHTPRAVWIKAKIAPGETVDLKKLV